MKLLKYSCIICRQNLRKWIYDYRIYIIILILFISVQTVSNPISIFCSSSNIKISPWLFPFLFTTPFSCAIFLFPIILIFCNAPFIDEAQPYSIIRSGRITWSTGQILYIIIASAFYLIFIIFTSILIHIGHIEWTLDWGKLLTTLGNSDLAVQIGLGSIRIYTNILNYFSPIQAMWFSFLFLWFTCIFIGMIIYFFNSLTNTRIVGVLIASAFLLLDNFLMFSLLPAKIIFLLYHFSPVTWVHLNIINIGYNVNTPTFTYVLTMYLILNGMLIIGSILINRKQTIEVLPPV